MPKFLLTALAVSNISHISSVDPELYELHLAEEIETLETQIAQLLAQKSSAEQDRNLFLSILTNDTTNSFVEADLVETIANIKEVNARLEMAQDKLAQLKVQAAHRSKS